MKSRGGEFRTKAIDKAKAEALNDILAVADNFERAGAAISPETDGERAVADYYAGVYETMMDCLSGLGLEEVENVSRPRTTCFELTQQAASIFFRSPVVQSNLLRLGPSRRPTLPLPVLSCPVLSFPVLYGLGTPMARWGSKPSVTLERVASFLGAACMHTANRYAFFSSLSLRTLKAPFGRGNVDGPWTSACKPWGVIDG